MGMVSNWNSQTLMLVYLTLRCIHKQYYQIRFLMMMHIYQLTLQLAETLSFLETVSILQELHLRLSISQQIMLSRFVSKVVQLSMDIMDLGPK